MEALVGGLIVVVIGQFSLLWYRIGRLEGRLTKAINGARKEGKDNAG